MSRTVASILLCGYFVVMQPARFSFAGLDLTVTTKELRLKYPTSQVVDDSLVYLSEKDSHDHISTIGLAGSGSTRSLRITFERRRKGGKPIYLNCENVVSVMEARYGRPTSIVEGQEGAGAQPPVRMAFLDRDARRQLFPSAARASVSRENYDRELEVKD